MPWPSDGLELVHGWRPRRSAILLTYAMHAGRTEVLPVQWRKHLHIEADRLARQLMVGGVLGGGGWGRWWGSGCFFWIRGEALQLTIVPELGTLVVLGTQSRSLPHRCAPASRAPARTQPPGIPSLRSVLHSTVVEILLFMTPRHRAEIVASLVTSLNTVYARFVQRNPGFKVRGGLWVAVGGGGWLGRVGCASAAASNAFGNAVAECCARTSCSCSCFGICYVQGSVSVLAHSLGSVLAYDVLCCQPAPAWQGLHTPPPSAAAAAAPSSSSLPASPGAGGVLAPGAGASAGVDAVMVDATAAPGSSPSSADAATPWELGRLRAENQRLQQLLEAANRGGAERSWGSGAGAGGGWEAMAGVEGAAASSPQPSQQQQWQWQSPRAAAATEDAGGEAAGALWSKPPNLHFR